MIPIKSKQFSRVIVLVVLLGLYIGWRLGNIPSDSEPIENLPDERSDRPMSGLLESRSMLSGTENASRFRYPEGAVEDEVVIMFKDSQSYLDYLATLQRAGIEPLGRIDALGVLRLDIATFTRFKTSQDAVEISFNFRISRPPPPLEALPSLALELKPYNQTAAQITGTLSGDGSRILVAVLDSGLYEHNAFEHTEVEELVLAGKHLDDPGAEHGTAVASIIGGKDGVASASSLLVVRVLGEDGLGHSFHAAEGIIRAVEKGAEIINMSFGLYQDSALLRHAVQYAQGRGVLLVASAGNDRYTVLPYPAAYPEVLSVTAIDARNRQAGFPNQSESIDFAAPGVAILTAAEEGKTQLFTGTSAATPFVTGTLASLLSRDPLQSPDQVVAELKQSLNESGALGPDPLYGGGWVDWDRLSDTGESERADIALADIHLPADALPGTNVPVEVIIQNRGNQWLSGGELAIQISDESEVQSFPLRSMQPGEALSYKVFAQIPPAHWDKLLRIAAQVKPDESIEDRVPENNFRIIELESQP